jgi:hypothetical protein
MNLPEPLEILESFFLFPEFGLSLEHNAVLTGTVCRSSKHQFD